MKTLLRTAFPLLLICLIVSVGYGQDSKANRPSPPAEASGMIGDATITVSYSSPAVKERTVWGDLVPYDKVWRTGANEATVFETSADIKVNGKNLAAGKYSLFTIPGKDKWTVIFNSVADQWGSYSYDASKDVLRVEVTPEEGEFKERMEFKVGAEAVVFGWENLELPIPIE